MYHYQHQKTQMLALGGAGQGHASAGEESEAEVTPAVLAYLYSSA